MSTSAEADRLGAALDGLEAQVDELVGEVAALRDALDGERSKASGLEERIHAAGGKGQDPVLLGSRIEALEKRNRELEERMARGRETAERILTRLRFLGESA